MKKLLMILVMVLWCNTSFAETIDQLLNELGVNEEGYKEDVGEENKFYNFIVDDFKKYAVESSIKNIMDYCSSISSNSPAGLIQIADCMYREDVRIIRKHDLDYKEQMGLLYSTYQTYRNIMVVAAVKSQNSRSTSVSEQINFKALVNMQTVWKRSRVEQWRLFHRVAEAEVRKLSEKKKKEEPPPDPDDDKVIAAASGTGFFVTKAGHIVTNNHVIEECNAIKVNFKSQETNTEIIAADKSNDLAIIKANITPNKIFPVSDKDVSLLQDIIIAGFPLGKDISAAIKTHKGSVTALAGYNDNYSNFQTDATINQGNSGGPIMNQKGNILGVAVATWVEEGVQGVHFGIKSSTLKTFAKANGIKFLSPNYREMSNADLGKLITEATVFVECWMTKAKIKKMIADAQNKKAFYSKFK